MSRIEFRSPERAYRITIWMIATIGALWMSVEARNGSERLGTAAMAATAFLAALRAMRSKVVVTDGGLLDIATIRARQYGWGEIVQARIGRVRGYFDGLRVNLELTDGREIGLKALQAYSYLPSAEHLAYLEEQARRIQAMVDHGSPRRDVKNERGAG